MLTPYDTGKVKIGIYYEKPRYCEHDKDMLLVQSWLIGDAARARKAYWTNVCYMALIAFVFLVMILKK